MGCGQQGSGPIGRKRPGKPSFSQLGQHGVQGADDSGALRHQVVVAVGQQTQNGVMILGGHGPQVAVTQRHYRGGAGVVSVGLVTTAPIQQPDPGRQR